MIALTSKPGNSSDPKLKNQKRRYGEVDEMVRKGARLVPAK